MSFYALLITYISYDFMNYSERELIKERRDRSKAHLQIYLVNTHEHAGTPLFINLGASLEMSQSILQDFLLVKMKGCKLFIISKGEPREDRNIQDDKAVYTH